MKKYINYINYLFYNTMNYEIIILYIVILYFTASYYVILIESQWTNDRFQLPNIMININ